MKATIQENGTLVITPENEMESYALIKWSEEFFVDENHRKATLAIETLQKD